MATPPEPSLSIGALALQTGASVRSIRHYDAHGLLTSSRSANGYRVFPAACVAQVRQIQRLIATGFSLDDILGFPDCMRLVEGAQMCPETAYVHRARLQQIERQLADLERRRGRLLETLAQGAADAIAASPSAAQTARSERAR
ncbi:MerR family transcriptional regulator [Xanthomonas prunicola]|uniref:MerR family transcriptional regulator n=1 Tax=Xanthomonas prunicola TaxID=2053930 RepID=A0A9Q9J138_9XANT|nr:MerR family transcriptional regulator [Xanthomonas prunicola]UXA50671.1 MerR family transcriptional regulator [Xanthomonas prunicola]UXA58979.1 MerR family transcriptional regulator [Xanthomonas prunicola]UXA61120.1 MerR family transcriptional regulator [Xanthomonas prunicola]UXA67187.1 MerR family transcriptional regulator [Xanthomonas prunicola]